LHSLDIIVFDLRLRPARFPCGQALEEELGLDVVLGFAVLVGAVVGGGVEGATLGSIVGAEPGCELVGVTLESTVGAELGDEVAGVTLESTVDPESLPEDGAVVLSVGAGFSG
jgi:hypothetical protein